MFNIQAEVGFATIDLDMVEPEITELVRDWREFSISFLSLEDQPDRAKAYLSGKAFLSQEDFEEQLFQRVGKLAQTLYWQTEGGTNKTPKQKPVGNKKSENKNSGNQKPEAPEALLRKPKSKLSKSQKKANLIKKGLGPIDTETRVGPFSGENRFLSNFWPAEIVYKGILFPTPEHAYQAHKSVIESEIVEMSKVSSPGRSKRAGSEKGLLREDGTRFVITESKDWEDRKFEVMLEIVSQKFFSHPELAQRLLNTEDWLICEDNDWGDTTWGMCNGQGENWLGIILMQVRQQLRKKQ